MPTSKRVGYQNPNLNTPEGRKAQGSIMGRASVQKRVMLSGAEVAALSQAYQLLTKIADRHKVKLDQYPLDGQPCEPATEATDQDAA